MPTGVVDLVAYGSLDTYLTGNPQITFFKTVYRRHSNFAIESVEQTFTQKPQFGKKTIITISKIGDLLQNMYALITLPALTDPSNYYYYGVGNLVIKKIDLLIAGTVIDTHYADWLNIWGELTNCDEKAVAYDKMVYNYFNITGVSSSFTCYVPLQFWFNRNPGLALPLIAIQGNEIQLAFEFEEWSNLYKNAGATQAAGDLDCRIFGDFVFLETEERRKIAQSTHEYLIDQVQYNEFLVASGSTFYNAKLKFNLPVKELIWVHSPTILSNYGGFDYSYNGGTILDSHTFTSGKLVINGSDRMSERYADYFYLVQNFQRHTRVPRTDFVHTTYNNIFTKQNGQYRNYIYTYSFSLDPEIHQPSGVCNFSRIKSSELQLKYNNTSYTDFAYSRMLKVFAVNKNILKIGGGVVGVIYSN
jgi:hypothetical protein